MSRLQYIEIRSCYNRSRMNKQAKVTDKYGRHKMSRRPLYNNDDSSSRRGSLDSSRSFDLTIEDPESQALYTPAYNHERHTSALTQLRSLLWTGLSFPPKYIRPKIVKYRGGKKAQCRLPCRRQFCLLFQILLAATILLPIFAAMVFPSYSSPPLRYRELRQYSEASSELGRANRKEQKVFIAASIFDRDGSLATGAWSKGLLELVDLLGPSNVFLSIYENDAGEKAKAALKALEERVPCKKAVVFEDRLDTKVLPHVRLPDGTERVKRIAYLAEVRNRALRPLALSSMRYDRILYLNDVIFDPVDAALLLFATNAESGLAKYRAACSMDFVNPFKFYDTFASRDLEGYSMGLPLYPWFSSAGQAGSRQDVCDEKDAVRVRSCWGGMVAFDARFFQSSPDELDDLDTASTIPRANFSGYRFRAEEELFWESAECCLIHADIQGPDDEDRGIYMNPYIRVAYDTQTLSWLAMSRRFERLYVPLQYMINAAVGLPRYNPRRADQPWQEVQHRVWTPDPSVPLGGSFNVVDRIASNAGFCGTRSLEVLNEKAKVNEKSWRFVPVPPL